MATQTQGNTNKVVGSFGYDNPTYITRQSAILAANAAGSGNASGKFIAHCALIVYGVTFSVTTAGTSTYTVAGTATNPATQMGVLYVTNTATNSIALATTTLTAAFTIGGTTTTGTNVNVGGIGGVAGGFQGPFAINTLGGTNTSLVWGSNTYLVTAGAVGTNTIAVGPPGGGAIGIGGLPMNPGDTLAFVNGTDATAVLVPIVHFTHQLGALEPL